VEKEGKKTRRQEVTIKEKKNEEQKRQLRFQVLTAASMIFRIVFWDVLPCKMIVDRRFRGTCCLHHHHP
jgi:hypothetical protein